MNKGSDFEKAFVDLANLDADHVHNRYKWCFRQQSDCFY